VNAMGGEAALARLLDPRVVAAADDYAARFQAASPFRHVVIDGFLEPRFCREIVAAFPSFDEKAALNEDGQVGGKATQEEIRALGPAYRALDDLVKSAGFRALISRISGIPKLEYDPHYFGGGTHENRAGQDLDAHIDFNYHPISRRHRRLNLIIYLNDEWRDAWGGSLQLHRDPYREPRDDEIVTITPLLNRCVLFETNERSWHGFEQIRLPDDKRRLSRKSFALYYYTRQRPREETAAEHSTVYVDRHLPEHIGPGTTLSEADYAEIRRLLLRRDHHLKRLYAQVSALTGRLAASRDGSVLRALRRRVHAFESATSWRITRPLRAVRSALRRHS